MRIFLSHSGRDKPLVREIIRGLPSHVRAWLDERELRSGTGLTTTIRDVIIKDTDFVVIFIGPEAVRSEWVRRELDWALERERELGRVFVLPVLLDNDSWLQLPKDFQDRRYLLCTDFTEVGVSHFSRLLADELFAWLSRLAAKSDQAPPPIQAQDEASRHERVRRLVSEIEDQTPGSPVRAPVSAALTYDRLALIVSLLDPMRRVELLCLYELEHGKFKGSLSTQDLEGATYLDIQFSFGASSSWTHRVEWRVDPFRALKDAYGLGTPQQYVRDTVLRAIGNLSADERLDVFSGIDITRCIFIR